MTIKQLCIVSAFAVGVSLGACRKAPPDEVVYDGKAASPSGASGGSASGGSGASGGTSPGGSWGFGGSAGSSTGGSGALDAGSDASPPAALSCNFLPETDESFTKQKLLRASAECALGRYAAFQTQAEVLSTEAAAAKLQPSAEARARAQLAWQRAISAWQEAELFRFGPAARPSEPGGQDHRDQIYAWPLTSRCKVEEQLVAQTYQAGDFSTSLINGRTLAALDYLLFYPGTDNACSNFSSINASGTWAALGSSELVQRKADYASSVANLVGARADQLTESWLPPSASHPAGQNFCAELALAGTGSTTFLTDQQGLNAVSDALFYVDKELKDWKLGRPVGYVDCFSTSCPESVELRFSSGSVAHILANLRGFRRLFQGCGEGGAGVGFDDWLIAAGAGDLAQRMLAALDAAEPAVAAIGNRLDEAVVSDQATVQNAYAKVKALTDLLKTEFVTVLNLDLPKTSEGDND